MWSGQHCSASEVTCSEGLICHNTAMVIILSSHQPRAVVHHPIRGHIQAARFVFQRRPQSRVYSHCEIGYFVCVPAKCRKR